LVLSEFCMLRYRGRAAMEINSLIPSLIADYSIELD
jgi:hypothetical protein